MSRPFRITFIHPCIGRRPGTRYLRSWQMEPLPLAVLAHLTPKDVEIRFVDDRMEALSPDEPTDLVALSVEVYTAKRAYQIASDYRRRGVPVVMGGFHASLLPEEVERYADAVVVGEAEGVWPEVVEDARHGRLRRRYQAAQRPDLADTRPDRSLFTGKRYLPVGLVEAGRGCEHVCEFCAIQSFYRSSHRMRPVPDIVAEIREIRDRSKLIFFVDDNIVADPGEAARLFEALVPLGIRWVSQGTLAMTRDEGLLQLMARSGCKGVLIGFESLDEANLQQMGKGINRAGLDYDRAMAALGRHSIRVYGTFVFGYDQDTEASFETALEFSLRHGFYLCGFNHLTPMPGTPLYARLEREGRLRFERWWLDDDYTYNAIPFHPARMDHEALHQACLRARRRFYGLPGTLRRALHSVNRSDWSLALHFLPVNLMHLAEIGKRDGHPLGDLAWHGPLLEVG